MPQWVLDAAGLDLDVASFSYPSRLWERTAITPAADDLKTWLETELKGYRHLLFVTHSTGGLVVKEMLRRAYRDGRGLSPDSDPDALPSLWLRTRRIINIAVPHRGGDPLMAGFGKVAYATVYPLMAPMLRTRPFRHPGGKGLGQERDHRGPALAQPVAAHPRTRVHGGRRRRGRPGATGTRDPRHLRQVRPLGAHPGRRSGPRHLFPRHPRVRQGPEASQRADREHRGGVRRALRCRSGPAGGGPNPGAGRGGQPGDRHDGTHRPGGRRSGARGPCRGHRQRRLARHPGGHLRAGL